MKVALMDAMKAAKRAAKMDENMAVLKVETKVEMTAEK